MPLTLFVSGYFIPTFDRGCADLRTLDKILKRAWSITSLKKAYS